MGTSGYAEPRLIKTGQFSGKLADKAVKITGVKPGPFEQHKLKVWHWQWNNPVVETEVFLLICYLINGHLGRKTSLLNGTRCFKKLLIKQLRLSLLYLGK